MAVKWRRKSEAEARMGPQSVLEARCEKLPQSWKLHFLRKKGAITHLFRLFFPPDEQ